MKQIAIKIGLSFPFDVKQGEKGEECLNTGGWYFGGGLARKWTNGEVVWAKGVETKWAGVGWSIKVELSRD